MANRTARAAVAFTFGAVTATTGLLAGIKANPVTFWFIRRPFEKDVEFVQEVMSNMVLIGLLIQGAALIAWVLAPRNDR